ncbi:Uncharacterised protein [Mycobacteroides abscessus subsp. abscessus]|nr:Uncharacterised protein [Mycobacteroides abscessus subsp. abscessus]
MTRIERMVWEMLPNFRPVPWVPVAAAPASVWTSMSPRLGSASPCRNNVRFSSCRLIPACTRTRS